MLTEEKLIEIFESHEDDWKKKDKDNPAKLPQFQGDTAVKAINLLREACPLDKVHCIIQGADHDVVYLIDLEEAYRYLTEEQAHSLAILGVVIDDNSDCLSISA